MVTAGGFLPQPLHCLCEAASRVRSHISPGPYRSFRELSLAGSVDPVIWCPPTFVGNSGIERFNGLCGFALLSCRFSFLLLPSRAEVHGSAIRTALQYLNRALSRAITERQNAACREVHQRQSFGPARWESVTH